MSNDPYNAVLTWVDPAEPRDGPLKGWPLLVKDLFDTAGVRTTYGSAIYRDHVPDRTAAAVELLVGAGAAVVGKANLFEFAWGVTSGNPHYGDVANPHRPGKTAGGSSSGNAAGLAAGLCRLAIGTDTGGSIRMPSACCGTVGFKPSLGKVPLDGCFPLCPSFDTAGPMARTVADCALAYSVLSGEPVPEPRLAGLTVGLLRFPPLLGPGDREPADDRAEAYADRLESLGARVVEAELPVPEADTWPVFYAEAVESHRATYPERADEYGPVVRAKLEEASRVPPEAIAAGYAALPRWRAQAARAPEVDLFVSPTLGVEKIPPADVDELAIRVRLSAYTRPFNYLGWPAIAIGELQLAGRDDATVLAAALAWEGA